NRLLLWDWLEFSSNERLPQARLSGLDVHRFDLAGTAPDRHGDRPTANRAIFNGRVRTFFRICFDDEGRTAKRTGHVNVLEQVHLSEFPREPYTRLAGL
ncbi:MAG TPA: hypothetical protein VFS35_03735, partial [Terrimicrobiaceae bacterium]|nr:hypothetical protein [Terrimicrobiaceae bacterium]